MRVRIKAELDCDDLRQGPKQIPAGRYSVTPLMAGTVVGETRVVAYRLDDKYCPDTYRIAAETFEAWRKAKKIAKR